MWNVENGVGLANSTKLFAPEDGPLNLLKRHWRTRLRIPEVSAILTIVGWRPLSFGWRPFMVCIPNATSKVTPMRTCYQTAFRTQLFSLCPLYSAFMLVALATSEHVQRPAGVASARWRQNPRNGRIATGPDKSPPLSATSSAQKHWVLISQFQHRSNSSFL